MEFMTENLPILLCTLFGVGLVVLEIFLPGFGVAGFSGCALLIGGITLTWIKYGVLPAVILLLCSLALAAVSITISVRSAAKGKLSRSSLILKNEEEDELPAEEKKVLIGREGVALTVLRPAGIAEFDGVRLNVVTEGDFLEKGTRVCITEAEGTRLVVKKIG